MRTRQVAAGVGVAVILVAAGVGVGVIIQSPSQQRPAAVPPTVLTAPVQSRVLTTQYSGTGTFVPAAILDVNPVAANDGLTVVTATPLAPGANVTMCRAVVEVNGRPVIALTGDLPAYRDLTTGDQGPDVAQLQQALTACGQRVHADGQFGPATDRAVRALYRTAGYQAQTVPAAQQPSSPDAGTSAARVPADGDVSPDPAAGTAAQPTAPSVQVVLPRAEVIFAPQPAQVTAVAARGTVLDDKPAATLAVGATALAVDLDAPTRAVLNAGLPVDIVAGDWSGRSVLPDLPTDPVVDKDSGTGTYPVKITVPDGAPAGLDGKTGTYTIVIGNESPYNLVVPTTALHYAGADTQDSAFVLVPGPQPTGHGTDPRKGQRKVEVTVLDSASGYSAVKPAQTDALTDKDEVVVGEG